MLIWMFPLACSVELLKVYVPPRGIEHIQAEDLQRDVWAQLNPESGFGHEEWLQYRFSQHEAELTYHAASDFCAQQEQSTIHLWVNDAHPSHRPYWTAILLSAAKGLEADKEGSFCLGAGNEGGVNLAQALRFHRDLPSEIWAPELIHYANLAAELRDFLTTQSESSD